MTKNNKKKLKKIMSSAEFKKKKLPEKMLILLEFPGFAKLMPMVQKARWHRSIVLRERRRRIKDKDKLKHSS